MKKFSKIIGVVLCALLAVSVFPVGASAKSYVKSIKVKKKATISMRASDKKISKTLKVTVKVSGKASKKFTAKSSKSSVASVKVKGSNVVVTAKKAGKTTVTVTTKGKNKSGKKIKAKIKVTVKKPSYVTNLKKVRDYIVKNGQDYGDGNKCIKDKDFAIVYDKANEALKFIDVNDQSTAERIMKTSMDMTVKINGDKTAVVNYIDESSSGKTTGSLNLNIRTYKSNKVYDFGLLDDYDNEDASDYLSGLTLFADSLLSDTTKLWLYDLGFASL